MRSTRINSSEAEDLLIGKLPLPSIVLSLSKQMLDGNQLPHGMSLDEDSSPFIPTMHKKNLYKSEHIKVIKVLCSKRIKLMRIHDFLNHEQSLKQNIEISRRRDSFSFFPAEPLVIDHGAEIYHSRGNSSLADIGAIKSKDLEQITQKEKLNSNQERPQISKIYRKSQKQFYRRKSDCSSLFGAQSALEQKTADLIIVPPSRIKESADTIPTEEKELLQSENQSLQKIKRNPPKKKSATLLVLDPSMNSLSKKFNFHQIQDSDEGMIQPTGVDAKIPMTKLIQHAPTKVAQIADQKNGPIKILGNAPQKDGHPFKKDQFLLRKSHPTITEGMLTAANFPASNIRETLLVIKLPNLPVINDVQDSPPSSKSRINVTPKLKQSEYIKRISSKDSSPSKFNTLNWRTRSQSNRKSDLLSEGQEKQHSKSPAQKNMLTPRNHSHDYNERILKAYHRTSQPNLGNLYKTFVRATSFKNKENGYLPSSHMHSQKETKIILEPSSKRDVLKLDTSPSLAQSSSFKNLIVSPLAIRRATQFTSPDSSAANFRKSGSQSARKS